MYMSRECLICCQSFSVESIPIQLCCCRNVICEVCISNILDLNKTRCPWCKTFWNRKRFLDTCKQLKDPDNLLVELTMLDKGEVTEYHESAHTALSILGDGSLRKDYEDARMLIMKAAQEKTLDQINKDAEIAKTIAEEEKKCNEEIKKVKVEHHLSISEKQNLSTEDSKSRSHASGSCLKRRPGTVALKRTSKKVHSTGRKSSDLYTYFGPTSIIAQSMKQADDIKQPWVCDQCTYSNHFSMLFCEVCNHSMN